jgi:hypothetical protein
MVAVAGCAIEVAGPPCCNDGSGIFNDGGSLCSTTAGWSGRYRDGGAVEEPSMALKSVGSV